MDEVESNVSLDRDIARLRDALAHDDGVPLGLISRLQAGVARDAADDTPVGWEPRVVVACVVWALVGGAAHTVDLPTMALIGAVSLAYAWLASWPEFVVHL